MTTTTIAMGWEFGTDGMIDSVNAYAAGIPDSEERDAYEERLLAEWKNQIDVLMPSGCWHCAGTSEVIGPYDEEIERGPYVSEDGELMMDELMNNAWLTATEIVDQEFADEYDEA